ncbi:hypothetical protein BVC80_1829g8 [Macleaya cordata]|uniref:Zinc finger protein n=1 Tax=Macleaya cordata TaxID=56857 RepID=A0A200QZ61_MACCD|nr:hypothetical protein BVC80_1829g8 [Macleaya cordata]
MVEERYTRPQRLVRQPSFVDYKKLRKLILTEKLAPCFDGVEDSEPNSDLEECPICFFFYPSLNRSRCCMKGICTECFLQMKPSPATQLTQCPFCKSSSYTVEYRGARTKEEKGLEQAEEQKVIEAKIRMRFEESQNADQVRLDHRNLSLVEVQSPMSRAGEASNGAIQDLRSFNRSLASGHVDAAESSVLNAWNERHAEFGVDLEEIMMMEAIWRSIQDSTLHKSSTQQSSGSNETGRSHFENYLSNESMSSSALVGPPVSLLSDSVTGGIAAAIARMAERNILQSGTFQSNQTNETQDENSIEQHEMGPVGSSEEPDFDDARSENECLSISSTSDDDSWDSFSACILERNQDSEDGLNSDEDPVMELIDTDDSCSSSVHTISDVGSPNCSNMYESLSCSRRSGPIAAETNFTAFANSNS